MTIGNYLIMFSIKTGKLGQPQAKRSAIWWIPQDAYLGFAINRKRLWDVPTFMGEVRGPRAYIRLEIFCLINAVLVIDFRRC